MELLKLQAELCKTFADPKRLFILKELRSGEKSVGQLAEKLGVRVVHQPAGGYGNAYLAGFAAAHGKYLMIIVKDTSDPSNTTYDILHEVRVGTYRRAVEAKDAQTGVVVDLIECRFTPTVDTRPGITQHATSYDDATLSGAPLIVKLQLPDRTFKFTKVYPTASATAGEVTDPISDDVQAFNDATPSGAPTIVAIVSGEHGCLLEVYPTISAEVEAHAGILLYPEAFPSATISGTPRLLTIPINSTTYFTKGYPTQS